jgi:16S rRNA (uracil1498-N3)-methyltransferase
MNLILFDESDTPDPERPTRVQLRDRRFLHIRDVHRAKPGDVLRVGRVDGRMGTGVITAMNDLSLDLAVDLREEPPPPLALKLFLALPRPKFLAKVLQTATSLGVKEIVLFNSYRVDKIYWSCQQIKPEEMRASCLLGLEQARDTILPKIELRPRFKPFVEDEMPSRIAGTEALLAHPVANRDCPRGLTHPLSLAIGPEGGFIDYEVKKLEEAGFETVKLSPRILKVETAVATLIGRLT